MSNIQPLVVVTDASEEPLTREETKLWLRIEEEEVHEDPLIDSLIEMARARYEEYTRRVPVTKTYDLYLDNGFPSGAITLPRYPLISIDSIKGFTDTDDTDTGGTSMSTSEYYVDTARELGRVVPFGAYSFPTATRVANAAIVRFTAGHSSETTGVPSHVKSSIKNMIAHAYEHRGDDDVKDNRQLEDLMDEAIRDELAVQDWG